MTLAHAAFDTVQPLTRKAHELAEEQRRAGAAKLGAIARAVDHAATRLDSDLPPEATHYVHRAADALERSAGAIRERDLVAFADDISEFVRRRPGVVLGASLLAGIAVSRLLMTPAPEEAGDEGRRAPRRSSTPDVEIGPWAE